MTTYPFFSHCEKTMIFFARNMAFLSSKRKRGNHKPTKNGLLKKENPTGSNKTKIRKIIDRTVMEANDFDHFLSLIKAQGIETDTGTSKNMVLLPNTNFRKKNIFTGAIPLVLFMGMNPSRNESKKTHCLYEITGRKKAA